MLCLVNGWGGYVDVKNYLENTNVILIYETQKKKNNLKNLFIIVFISIHYIA